MARCSGSKSRSRTAGSPSKYTYQQQYIYSTNGEEAKMLKSQKKSRQRVTLTASGKSGGQGTRTLNPLRGN